MNIEKFGQLVGKTVGKKGLEYLQNRVKDFNLQVSGLDKLKSITGEAYLLVANHIRPANKLGRGSGVSPDAFILSKLAEEATQTNIKIVQKSDDGWWANNIVQRSFQKNVSQAWGRGFVNGLGNIPVQKNPHSFNRNFLQLIDKAVINKEGILIFPEGNWYQDFGPEHKIEPGVAHLAKKYNLKIIPAYIKGADTWEKNKKVWVSFADSFSTEDLTKDQISEKIRDNIIKLQEKIKE